MYKRLCKGLETKGRLIPANNDTYDYIDNPEQDWYVSTFLYNEEQKKDFEATGTIQGVVDVITDKLWWDFDNEFEPSEAKKSTIVLVDRLINLGIAKEDICIAFSGNKGFGVELKVDKLLTPKEVKNIAFEVGKDLLHLDNKMYNASRIFRVIGTKHKKTGLYKTPLTYLQLKELPMDNLMQLAKSSPEDNNEFRWNSITLPDYLYVQKKEVMPVKVQVVEDIDFTKKIKGWSNCKWAISQGYDVKSGDRHEKLLCVVATSKALNYSKEQAYYNAKNADEQGVIRNGGSKSNKDEVWTLVESVYSDGWKGGTFSCKDGKTPWLTDVCNSLGHYKCKHEEDKIFSEFGELSQIFNKFATDIDKNKIKTGIQELDDNVTLVTSTLVGLLGNPGCHAKDTEILMYDGSIKKVQDIKVGELLMGPDSSSREVLQLRSGREKMVKIKPLRSEEFIVNMNHILHLTPSKLKTKNRLPGNLNITVENYIKGLDNKERTMLSSYKLLKTKIEFKERNLTIPPYILGLWLGDGASDGTKLTTMDQEILIEWQNYADSINLEVKKYEHKNNRSSTYAITGARKSINTFQNKLKEYNLLNNKHIPKDYLLNSFSNRAQLLAGLIDTDGCCEANKRGWEISQKNKNIADGIVFLARSLGFHAKMTKTKKYCTSKGVKVFGDYYVIYISGEETNKIPVKLTRKKILHKIKTNPLHQGFTYEILEEDNYYGFTLNKDHLYLTSDFFIHHNSGKTNLSLNILNNCSINNIPSVFFSMDMGVPLIYLKLAQKHKGYTHDKIFQMYKNKDPEVEGINKLIESNYKNVKFSFRSGLTVDKMKESILAHQEKTGQKIKLVVVDYLECILGEFSDATANTALIANQLKDLANETETCVLLLLQTQKHSAAPDEPLLSMKNIKGSSVIEQAASVILTLWREGYSPKYADQDKYISIATVKDRFNSLWRQDFKWAGLKGTITDLEDFEREELEDLRNRKKQEKSSSGTGFNF